MSIVFGSNEARLVLRRDVFLSSPEYDEMRAAIIETLRERREVERQLKKLQDHLDAVDAEKNLLKKRFFDAGGADGDWINIVSGQ